MIQVLIYLHLSQNNLKLPFIDLATLPTKEIIPGYTAWSIQTGTITFMFQTVEPGAEIPTHSHIQEQLANVLNGSFELTNDGLNQLLQPGMLAVIPALVKHIGKAITACELLDVFNPEREDYKFKLFLI